MINANELRIGNWVKHANHSNIRKEFIGVPMQWRVQDFEFPNYYDPVPLTPEILGKAGFKLTDDGISPYWRLVLMRTEVISIEDDWSVGLNAENEKSTQGYATVPDRCKFVHQLQNLYFALAGTELEITL